MASFIIACGYATGSMSCEEAILVAYARGYGCQKVKQKLIRGLMVAVGLSKEEVTKMLPEGVFIACHNSSSNVTISGPEKITKDFLSELQARGVFAKEINTANIAFHSKYVEEVRKCFEEILGEIFKDPKPRSSKWISSSVPPEKAEENWAKMDSVEYHLNNFHNPVLFDQIYEHIPENAIVIEIAPHGLLQAILKRELCPTITNIPLTNRVTPDCQQFLLSAIGK